MAGITAAGGVELIRQWVAAGRALLGICVGHQILFERGLEHGESVPGIGLFPGEVSLIKAERLPHMGWNRVSPAQLSTLFTGVEQERFYFVHSYAAQSEPAGARVSFAEHGGQRFVAAVEQGTVCSTQFHPEKSGRAGAKLIANWLENLG